MIKNEQILTLLDGVSYIEYEAEALKYIIDTVPYRDILLKNGKSLIEGLIVFDLAQKYYYREIIDAVLAAHRPINLNAFSMPREINETGEKTAELLRNPQKVLSKIAKHRAAISTRLETAVPADWHRNIIHGKEICTLYAFIQKMVHNDKNVLKEIAGSIQVHSNKQNSS